MVDIKFLRERNDILPQSLTKKPQRKKKKSRVKEFIDYAIYLFFGE